LRGLDSACTQGGAGRGYGRDGGLAPYVLATPRDLIPLVTLDPITAGPLTDAGATAYHAVHRVLPRLGPGSIAVVIGAGGLGAFAVQLLRVLSAARVIAVDTNPARLAIAADLGAHETALGSGAGLQLSGTGGADAVLDFVGVDDTITAGVGAVAAGGAYALVGAGGGTLRRPWQATLPRDGEVFTFQGSCIRDAHAVVHLVEAGLIRNEVEVFPFDDVVEAYRRLDAGELRGRAVVRPPE
jgi:propanol-preferring alcohol dehydrogenase